MFHGDLIAIQLVRNVMLYPFQCITLVMPWCKFAQPLVLLLRITGQKWYIVGFTLRNDFLALYLISTNGDNV